ncbi:MAG: universal stress protein [Thermus sp.]|uniref:universal stress protein n=1 Tax=Thermus sp. TaxID=275 RepID=UPI00298F339A|nr:universal stress protein [Thermus sp.]MDW8016571.1 universal stress protein [Thermus sp.]MDW8357574.1 universal stress protein [Thermus sp.]
MRILLATDGSPQARGAEVLAEWLCYKLSAKLVALFVRDVRLVRVPELLDFGALTIPLPAYREELEKALTAKGEALLGRLAQSAREAGIPVETLMETGLPHEVILRHARAADLLVLGRSGEAHGGSFAGLGSTVDRVLRASPTPVLVAPTDYVELEGAILGYNASESAVRALHTLASLAKPLGLRVRVVSVHDDPAQAGAWALEAEAYLQDQGLRVEALAFSGDPAEHLLALQGPSDLLALGAPVRRLVLGSTAEHVVRHAVGPVLTVR